MRRLILLALIGSVCALPINLGRNYAASYAYTDDNGTVQHVLYTSDETGIKVVSNVPANEMEKIIDEIKKQQQNLETLFFPSFGFPAFPNFKSRIGAEDEEAPYLSTIYMTVFNFTKPNHIDMHDNADMGKPTSMMVTEINSSPTPIQPTQTEEAPFLSNKNITVTESRIKETSEPTTTIDISGNEIFTSVILTTKAVESVTKPSNKIEDKNETLPYPPKIDMNLEKLVKANSTSLEDVVNVYKDLIDNNTAPPIGIKAADKNSTNFKLDLRFMEMKTENGIDVLVNNLLHDDITADSKQHTKVEESGKNIEVTTLVNLPSRISNEVNKSDNLVENKSSEALFVDDKKIESNLINNGEGRSSKSLDNSKNVENEEKDSKIIDDNIAKINDKNSTEALNHMIDMVDEALKKEETILEDIEMKPKLEAKIIFNNLKTDVDNKGSLKLMPKSKEELFEIVEEVENEKTNVAEKLHDDDTVAVEQKEEEDDSEEKPQQKILSKTKNEESTEIKQEIFDTIEDISKGIRNSKFLKSIQDETIGAKPEILEKLPIIIDNRSKENIESEKLLMTEEGSEHIGSNESGNLSDEDLPVMIIRNGKILESEENTEKLNSKESDDKSELDSDEKFKQNKEKEKNLKQDTTEKNTIESVTTSSKSLVKILDRLAETTEEDVSRSTEKLNLEESDDELKNHSSSEDDFEKKLMHNKETEMEKIIKPDITKEKNKNVQEKQDTIEEITPPNSSTESEELNSEEFKKDTFKENNKNSEEKLEDTIESMTSKNLTSKEETDNSSKELNSEESENESENLNSSKENSTEKSEITEEIAPEEHTPSSSTEELNSEEINLGEFKKDTSKEDNKNSEEKLDDIIESMTNKNLTSKETDNSSEKVNSEESENKSENINSSKENSTEKPKQIKQKIVKLENKNDTKSSTISTLDGLTETEVTEEMAPKEHTPSSNTEKLNSEELNSEEFKKDTSKKDDKNSEENFEDVIESMTNKNLISKEETDNNSKELNSEESENESENFDNSKKDSTEKLKQNKQEIFKAKNKNDTIESVTTSSTVGTLDELTETEVSEEHTIDTIIEINDSTSSTQSENIETTTSIMTTTTQILNTTLEEEMNSKQQILMEMEDMMKILESNRHGKTVNVKLIDSALIAENTRKTSSEQLENSNKQLSAILKEIADLNAELATLKLEIGAYKNNSNQEAKNSKKIENDTIETTTNYNREINTTLDETTNLQIIDAEKKETEGVDRQNKSFDNEESTLTDSYNDVQAMTTIKTIEDEVLTTKLDDITDSSPTESNKDNPNTTINELDNIEPIDTTEGKVTDANANKMIKKVIDYEQKEDENDSFDNSETTSSFNVPDFIELKEALINVDDDIITTTELIDTSLEDAETTTIKNLDENSNSEIKLNTLKLQKKNSKSLNVSNKDNTTETTNTAENTTNVPTTLSTIEEKPELKFEQTMQTTNNKETTTQSLDTSEMEDDESIETIKLVSKIIEETKVIAPNPSKLSEKEEDESNETIRLVSKIINEASEEKINSELMETKNKENIEDDKFESILKSRINVNKNQPESESTTNNMTLNDSSLLMSKTIDDINEMEKPEFEENTNIEETTTISNDLTLIMSKALDTMEEPEIEDMMKMMEDSDMQNNSNILFKILNIIEDDTITDKIGKIKEILLEAIEVRNNAIFEDDNNTSESDSDENNDENEDQIDHTNTNKPTESTLLSVVNNSEDTIDKEKNIKDLEAPKSGIKIREPKNINLNDDEMKNKTTTTLEVIETTTSKKQIQDMNIEEIFGSHDKKNKTKSENETSDATTIRTTSTTKLNHNKITKVTEVPYVEIEEDDDSFVDIIEEAIFDIFGNSDEEEDDDEVVEVAHDIVDMSHEEIIRTTPKMLTTNKMMMSASHVKSKIQDLSDEEDDDDKEEEEEEEDDDDNGNEEEANDDEVVEVSDLKSKIRNPSNVHKNKTDEEGLFLSTKNNKKIGSIATDNSGNRSAKSVNEFKLEKNNIDNSNLNKSVSSKPNKNSKLETEKSTTLDIDEEKFADTEHEVAIMPTKVKEESKISDVGFEDEIVNSASIINLTVSEEQTDHKNIDKEFFIKKINSKQSRNLVVEVAKANQKVSNQKINDKTEADKASHKIKELNVDDKIDEVMELNNRSSKTVNLSRIVAEETKANFDDEIGKDSFDSKNLKHSDTNNKQSLKSVEASHTNKRLNDNDMIDEAVEFSNRSPKTVSLFQKVAEESKTNFVDKVEQNGFVSKNLEHKDTNSDNSLKLVKASQINIELNVDDKIDKAVELNNRSPKTVNLSQIVTEEKKTNLNNALDQDGFVSKNLEQIGTDNDQSLKSVSASHINKKLNVEDKIDEVLGFKNISPTTVILSQIVAQENKTNLDDEIDQDGFISKNFNHIGTDNKQSLKSVQTSQPIKELNVDEVEFNNTSPKTVSLSQIVAKENKTNFDDEIDQDGFVNTKIKQETINKAQNSNIINPLQATLEVVENKSITSSIDDEKTEQFLKAELFLNGPHRSAKEVKFVPLIEEEKKINFDDKIDQDGLVNKNILKNVIEVKDSINTKSTSKAPLKEEEDKNKILNIDDEINEKEFVKTDILLPDPNESPKQVKLVPLVEVEDKHPKKVIEVKDSINSKSKSKEPLKELEKKRKASKIDDKIKEKEIVKTDLLLNGPNKNPKQVKLISSVEKGKKANFDDKIDKDDFVSKKITKEITEINDSVDTKSTSKALIKEKEERSKISNVHDEVNKKDFFETDLLLTGPNRSPKQVKLMPLIEVEEKTNVDNKIDQDGFVTKKVIEVKDSIKTKSTSEAPLIKQENKLNDEIEKREFVKPELLLDSPNKSPKQVKFMSLVEEKTTNFDDKIDQDGFVNKKMLEKTIEIKDISNSKSTSKVPLIELEKKSKVSNIDDKIEKEEFFKTDFELNDPNRSPKQLKFMSLVEETKESNFDDKIDQDDSVIKKIPEETIEIKDIRNSKSSSKTFLKELEEESKVYNIDDEIKEEELFKADSELNDSNRNPKQVKFMSLVEEAKKTNFDDKIDQDGFVKKKIPEEVIEIKNTSQAPLKELEEEIKVSNIDDEIKEEFVTSELRNKVIDILFNDQNENLNQNKSSQTATEANNSNINSSTNDQVNEEGIVDQTKPNSLNERKAKAANIELMPKIDDKIEKEEFVNSKISLKDKEIQDTKSKIDDEIKSNNEESKQIYDKIKKEFVGITTNNQENHSIAKIEKNKYSHQIRNSRRLRFGNPENDFIKTNQLNTNETNYNQKTKMIQENIKKINAMTGSSSNIEETVTKKHPLFKNRIPTRKNYNNNNSSNTNSKINKTTSTKGKNNSAKFSVENNKTHNSTFLNNLNNPRTLLLLNKLKMLHADIIKNGETINHHIATRNSIKNPVIKIGNNRRSKSLNLNRNVYNQTIASNRRKITAKITQRKKLNDNIDEVKPIKTQTPYRTGRNKLTSRVNSLSGDKSNFDANNTPEAVNLSTFPTASTNAAIKNSRDTLLRGGGLRQLSLQITRKMSTGQRPAQPDSTQ